MALKIDRFRILNKKRGSAQILATFDVNLGPLTIRGYEIVRAGNNTFVSAPANVYKKSDGSGWDRFNFVVYDGPKGEALEKQIETDAMDELRRRGAAAQPAKKESYGGFDDGDDGLPF